MDTGMALKPVNSVAPSHGQPDIAIAPAARTELPAAKTVAPVTHTEAARNNAQLIGHSTTHDAVIDPETREVVYRILDARTRQVLHQIPDQALLRMQAYARAQAARAMAEGENPITTAQTVMLKIDAVA